MKKSIVIVIALIMALQGSILAAAVGPNEVNKLKSKNESIKSQIVQTQNDKEIALKKHAKIAKQIAVLDQQMNSANAALDKVTVGLNNLENKIAVTTVELKRAERDAKKQNELLKKRLKAMYQNGFEGYISVVLSATSYSDFITRLNYLTRIVKYDNNILKELERVSALVAEKQLKLKNNMAKKEKVKVSLNKIKNEVFVATENKQAYMDKINQDIKELKNQEEELQQQAKALAKQIEKLLSKGKYTGGTMTWPLPGYYRISSDYGMRLHPVYQVMKMHDGIDLPAPGGTPIISAAAGRVLAASYSGGVGNHVVIDHGGRITSNYYHASKILVNVGQNVSKGQTIALVGTTGTSTGNHLHFEVRKNSNSVNPMRYLKN